MSVCYASSQVRLRGANQQRLNTRHSLLLPWAPARCAVSPVTRQRNSRPNTQEQSGWMCGFQRSRHQRRLRRMRALGVKSSSTSGLQCSWITGARYNSQPRNILRYQWFMFTVVGVNSSSTQLIQSFVMSFVKFNYNVQIYCAIVTNNMAMWQSRQSFLFPLTDGSPSTSM